LLLAENGRYKKSVLQFHDWKIMVVNRLHVLDADSHLDYNEVSYLQMDLFHFLYIHFLHEYENSRYVPYMLPLLSETLQYMPLPKFPSKSNKKTLCHRLL